MRSSKHAIALAASAALLSACHGGPSGPGLPEIASPSGLGKAMSLSENSFPPPAGYKIIYRFTGGDDGSDPLAGLTLLNGSMYGTTSGNGKQQPSDGTVFAITPAGVEKTIFRFSSGASGSKPSVGLVAVNGTLYGTTLTGGAYGKGIVFAMTPAGKETVLYSFKGGADGARPLSSLVFDGNMLFGTTSAGGSTNNGTVFSLTVSGSERVLYSFAGGKDGAMPRAALTMLGGVFYGTTAGGGTACPADKSGCGTVFSLTKTGKERVLYRFAGGVDGARPFAGLRALSGVLYGATVTGGDLGYGAVYSITTAGDEKVLFRFSRSFGGGPASALTYANGTFYGTTSGYAGRGYGSIFKVSPAGAAQVLYRFQGSPDGRNPQSAVILVNGALYGTTKNGGSNTSDNGTVFRLSL